MRRLWNLAGKYDLTKGLLPIIAVMIGLALLTGGKPGPQPEPTPVPTENEVILVILPQADAVDDLADPFGYWVPATENGIVRLLHEGNRPVTARVSYWSVDKGCIEVYSLLPFKPGNELILSPRLSYCDGVFVQAIEGTGTQSKELALARK